MKPIQPADRSIMGPAHRSKWIYAHAVQEMNINAMSGTKSPLLPLCQRGNSLKLDFYPVTQNAPHVSVGINVLYSRKGQCPKATDVSPWYGVYPSLQKRGRGDFCPECCHDFLTNFR
jgi:hypothetical protein